jgi:hypothetical protein
MDDLINIGALFFMLSGMIAWAVFLFLFWIYWICKPQKKGDL